MVEAGGIPVHLPLDLAPSMVIGRLDGIVLSGGTDVDPGRYGDSRHQEVTAVEPERDEFEFGLLDHAIEAGVPVLGICRGLQILDVHLRGTLEQHVPDRSRYDVTASKTAHEVTFTADFRLADIYNSSLWVNSMHHQVVATLGTDLDVTATSSDGVIEGVEMGESVVAVQRHPEMFPILPTDPIFSWIVERAAARRRPTSTLSPTSDDQPVV